MFEIREMTGQTYKNVYAGQPDTHEPEPAKAARVDEPHPEADDTGQRELVGVG